MKCTVLLVTLIAAPVVTAGPYVYLEDLGSFPEYPPGLHTYDLMVATQGMDWSMASMAIDIEAGEIWEHPFGWDGPPGLPTYFEFPDIAWDTFVTFPEAFPNTFFGEYFGVIVSGSFYSATTGEGPIMWVDLTTNQDGPYVIARLTVTEDFVGRIEGAAYFSETGWDPYPFSFWIPEPGTLAGLVLLARLAIRRARM